MERLGQEQFDAGFILGLLVGEGHFGGDRQQPAIVLKMHIRHERIFRWLKVRFPYAKLYGPYTHDGRTYWQMMWRGTALKYGLMPLLEALPWEAIDEHSFKRYVAMKQRYKLEDVPVISRRKIPGLVLPESPSDLGAEGPLLGDPIAPRESVGGEGSLFDD